jgi:hypothetical protein
MSHPANQPLSSDPVKQLSLPDSTEGEDSESSSSSSFSSEEESKGSLSLKSQLNPSLKSIRFTEKEESKSLLSIIESEGNIYNISESLVSNLEIGGSLNNYAPLSELKKEYLSCKPNSDEVKNSNILENKLFAVTGFIDEEINKNKTQTLGKSKFYAEISEEQEQLNEIRKIAYANDDTCQED